MYAEHYSVLLLLKLSRDKKIFTFHLGKTNRPRIKILFELGFSKTSAPFAVRICESHSKRIKKKHKP